MGIGHLLQDTRVRRPVYYRDLLGDGVEDAESTRRVISDHQHLDDDEADVLWLVLPFNDLVDRARPLAYTWLRIEQWLVEVTHQPSQPLQVVCGPARTAARDALDSGLQRTSAARADRFPPRP